MVLERGLAGMGASSRAAGIVRAQGGTPATVALGRWTIDFYNGQQAAYGTDSGFRELGYLILAVTDDDERAGRERVAMQRANGLDVAWLDAAEAAATRRHPRPDRPPRRPLHRDRRRDRPAAQRPRLLAGDAGGRRRAARADGVHGAANGAGGRRADRVVTASRPIAGAIETERVLLTGGPSLRAVGRAAGLRIPAGAARHTVAACSSRTPRSTSRGCRWSSTSGEGLYWRLEEGGLLFGWSDPDETPGRGAPDRLGVLRADAGAAGRVRAADPRPGPAPDLGRDDRLHPRPPADPRPGRRSRTAAGSTASRWPRPAVTG